jgi:MFS family permease
MTGFPSALGPVFGRQTAAQEWRDGWVTVLVSAAGISIANMHVFSISLMMKPLGDEFGWSRAEISSGMLFATVTAALLAPFVGRFVDHKGARRTALIGIPLYGLMTAAFGSINGSIWLYWLMWIAVGASWAMISPVIWTAAIAPRFDRGRALALAVGLSGLGIGAALTPLIVGNAQVVYGWRAAYVITALGWVAVIFPLIYFFFETGGRAAVPSQTIDDPKTVSLLSDLRSQVFLRLTFAGFAMTFAVLGLNAHLVPILTERSIGQGAAVWIAGLIGLGSIVGRIGTGFLLDRFHTPKLAAAVFFLPFVGCMCLIFAQGSFMLALLGALLVGLALGGEFDVLAYLASRYFPAAKLGSRFGWIMMASGVAGGLGPLASGIVRDISGSYTPQLLMLLPVSFVGAWLLARLPPIPQAPIIPDIIEELSR